MANLPATRKRIDHLLTFIEPSSLRLAVANSTGLVDKRLPSPRLSRFLLIIIPLEHPKQGASASEYESALSFPAADFISSFNFDLATRVVQWLRSN